MRFVFGSNLMGIHGAGAAKYAREHRGAVLGVGKGPTGECYAIPTKDYHVRTLPLPEIGVYVAEFLAYAENHTDQTFQVTQIGCGLAGFTKAQIAPLFKTASPNCLFDTEWLDILGPSFNYWGTNNG